MAKRERAESLGSALEASAHGPWMTRPPRDEREVKLLKEVEARREELVYRAEALRRHAVATFDPREKMRENPLGGVLASMSAGVLLSMIPERRRAAREAPCSPAAADGSGIAPSLRQALLAEIVWTMVPAFVEPLFSFLKSFGNRDSGAPG